jgi:signal transduction histidine kinase
MKSLKFKKLPRGNLTILFLAVAVISIVTLVWMGFRLVGQDRELEVQRLEELREQAADQFVSGLTEAIEEVQSKLTKNPSLDFLVTTGDTLLVEATSKAVQVFPEGSILYYPVTFAGQDDSSQLFAPAERFEFVNRDFDGAIEALGKLAQAEDPAVRAGAKLRLARNLRKAGQPEAALRVYEELAGGIDPEILVSGVPVDLLARSARCRMLEELGYHEQLKEDANAFNRGLQTGRWRLDRPSYDYYSGQLARWIEREQGADPIRRALPEAVVQVWNEWVDSRNGERESLARRGWRVRENYILVLTLSSSDNLTALILGPRYQQKRWFNPLLEKSEFTGIRVTLDNAGDVWRLGDEAPDGDSETVRYASVTGLPWDIALTGASFEEELSQFAQRRQLMAAGLGILILFLVASSYVMSRAVSRELAAARLQSDFVSAVSHEFRTPLTSMRQFTEMLLDDDSLPAEKRNKFYRAQERSTRRLSRLVESLLDFGRMEAGARPYRLERLDAGQLVRDVVEEFRAEPACQDFVIDCTIPKEQAIMSGDREALAQALWNLLDNAVKYSGSNRKVEVELEIGRQIAIHVRDQGVGVEVSEGEQIFSKFTRGSSAKALRIKGTGIGLAMVKHVVDAHGGTVTVSSEPDRGSTFTVYLPAGGGVNA